jgi:hypothetical protein
MVEVRRAIPVSHPSNAGAAVTSSAPSPQGQASQSNVGERRIVETTPDGRTRTTIIRTVRAPGRGRIDNSQANGAQD